MYKIIGKEFLNPTVVKMTIAAPFAAKRAKPGQFVMLRHGELGERIPLTIAGADGDNIDVIFQIVGESTKLFAELDGYIDDVLGPLGAPSELAGLRNVIVVGGGLGCAIAYPQAKALRESGAKVTTIAGFRDKSLVILEDEFSRVSDNLIITTDDGSYGRAGRVTEPLGELIAAGGYDAVIAVGPLIMMKFVAAATRPFDVKTYVSMNPLMVDGTGMCGCCRVTVGGEVKFACVDGPDFDGHQVDFDECMRRNAIYDDHECRFGL